MHLITLTCVLAVTLKGQNSQSHQVLDNEHYEGKQSQFGDLS